MIDWNKPLEDKNGNPAFLVAENYRSTNGKQFNRLVLMKRDDYDVVYAVDENGLPYGGIHSFRNKKVKREGWINIYRAGVTSSIYETEGRATQCRTPDCIATIRIEWEE